MHEACCFEYYRRELDAHLLLSAKMKEWLLENVPHVDGKMKQKKVLPIH
jgi:hypothetical protein